MTAIATEKSSGEAKVNFHVVTKESEKSSSFSRKLELKKGEKKSFKLKSELKRLNYVYFLVTAYYEPETKMVSE